MSRLGADALGMVLMVLPDAAYNIVVEMLVTTIVMSGVIPGLVFGAIVGAFRRQNPRTRRDSNQLPNPVGGTEWYVHDDAGQRGPLKKNSPLSTIYDFPVGANRTGEREAMSLEATASAQKLCIDCGKRPRADGFWRRCRQCGIEFESVPREAIAYHESSHAVMAVCLGGRVETVEIDERYMCQPSSLIDMKHQPGRANALLSLAGWRAAYFYGTARVYVATRMITCAKLLILI